MKVILCCLTGIGNTVLKTLVRKKIKILKIYTREEKNKFPYFKCENIVNVANKLNIPVSYSDPKNLDADLCLVTTYHKKIILKKNNFKLSINIHPSYLPNFKGRDPIGEALTLKAKFLGVSAHFMTENFDEGRIIIQKKIEIKKNDNKSSIIYKMLPIYDEFTKYIIKNYYKILKVKV